MAEHINGVDEAIRDLLRLASPERIQQALTQATLLLEREARKKAPKEEIARSITSTVEGEEGIVYTPLEYAPYVEYGTGKFSEHPEGGRKELPWVYVKDSTQPSRGKTIHTEESANQAVAFLRSKGLEAYKTYGQEPKPFMRPAIDENRDAIIEKLREGLLRQ